MKVVLADALGMCFGVRDALAALERLSEPTQVTIFGELVHNETVLARLAERGFKQTREDARSAIPSSPTLLVTAHGISNRERLRLLDAGKTLIDTTCPLVHRVHRAAQEFAERGLHVLVIGKRGHVEVEGVVQDLASYDVVETPAEVRDYGQARLGIVCQSTASPALANEIVTRVELSNPASEIYLADTICEPTRRRQRAMHALVAQVEAVVVVGGSRSNNTLALVEFCRVRGMPVEHVQTAADLDYGWLSGFRCVGLTAGTSTLPETVEEVHRALLSFSDPKSN